MVALMSHACRATAASPHPCNRRQVGSSAMHAEVAAALACPCRFCPCSWCPSPASCSCLPCWKRACACRPARVHSACGRSLAAGIARGGVGGAGSSTATLACKQWHQRTAHVSSLHRVIRTHLRFCPSAERSSSSCTPDMARPVARTSPLARAGAGCGRLGASVQGPGCWGATLGRVIDS